MREQIALAATPSYIIRASATECGSSTYIDHTELKREVGFDFTIKVYPRGFVRVVPAAHAVTVDMWHAVQACVSGLSGSTADSIWDQLECHQYLSAVLKRLASGPDALQRR